MEFDELLRKGQDALYELRENHAREINDNIRRTHYGKLASWGKLIHYVYVTLPEALLEMWDMPDLRDGDLCFPEYEYFARIMLEGSLLLSFCYVNGENGVWLSRMPVELLGKPMVVDGDSKKQVVRNESSAHLLNDLPLVLAVAYERWEDAKHLQSEIDS